MNLNLYRHTTIFYSISVAVPWSVWFGLAYLSHTYPGRHPLLIGFLGIVGLMVPFLTSLALMLPVTDLRQDLLNRLTNIYEVKPRWWFLAILIMPLSILLSQVLTASFGYGWDQFQFRYGFTFTSGVLPVSVLLIIAPILEELAWHSYGTDSLRNRFNLLNTSLLFGLFWGVWHFPLSFIKDYYQSNLVNEGIIYSLNFFISLFPFVLIMNWLYYKANRNILITILFHISAVYFNEIFLTHPISKVVQTGLLCAFVLFLIFHNPSFFLNNKEVTQ